MKNSIWTQVNVYKDMRRELVLAAAINGESIKNILSEAFDLWKEKHRINDEIQRNK